MKHHLLAVALIVGTSALAMGATALPADTTVFNPDVPVIPPGAAYYSTALPAYMLNPANLVDTLVSNYVPNPLGGFTGTLTSRVWRDPGDGTLTFEYVWNNTTPGNPVDVLRSTIGDPGQRPWANVAITDVGSDGTGTTTPGAAPNWSDGDPYFILRDPTVTGEGLTVQWRAFSSGTSIRNTTNVSARVFFDTDAIYYTTTNVGVLDSGVTSNAQGFAPGIPEPATMALLGLVGVPFILRRRRHA